MQAERERHSGQLLQLRESSARALEEAAAQARLCWLCFLAVFVRCARCARLVFAALLCHAHSHGMSLRSESAGLASALCPLPSSCPRLVLLQGCIMRHATDDTALGTCHHVHIFIAVIFTYYINEARARCMSLSVSRARPSSTSASGPQKRSVTCASFGVLGRQR